MNLFKIIFIVFAAVVVSYLFTDCSLTKEGYLKKFESFVEQVETQGGTFTEAKWQETEQTFNTLSGKEYDKFKAELTSDEKKQIVKLQARYRAAQVKFGIKYLKDSLKEIFE